MIMRIRAYSLFGKWLYEKMIEHDCGVYELAENLRIAPRTIYHHLKGTAKPSFTSVVAYCWYFNDESQPQDIWEMISDI